MIDKSKRIDRQEPTELDNIKTSLEAAIDRMGLESVLELVATICDEKAEHIETNWQDKVLATIWSAAALRISKTAEKVKI